MITIPMWVFITLSILAAIGGFSILLVAFILIRVKMHNIKADEEIRKRWDKE